MNGGEVHLQLVLEDRLDALGTLDVLAIRGVKLHVPLLGQDGVETSNVLAAARGGQVHFVSRDVAIVSYIFFARDCTEFLPARWTYPLWDVSIEKSLEEPRSQGAFEHGFVPEWAKKI